MAKKLTQEEVISSYIKIHGSKYDYTNTVYVNNRTKLTIFCPIHKDFTISPKAHKELKQGCPKCGLINRALSQQNDVSDILNRFYKTHGDLYDYSLMEYKGLKSKITILCEKHGPFEQTPEHHFKATGCRGCKPTKCFHNRLTYKNRQTILYYIKVNDLYKIGVSLDFKKRFMSDIKNGVVIEVIKLWSFTDGAIAFDREQEILYEFQNNKYNGEDILRGGNSELFYTDVLKLDLN